MLHYRQRPKEVIVSRQPAADGTAAIRLGTISKASFKVEIAAEAKVTSEERQEIDSVAAIYRSAATSHRQWSALKFPETTGEVLEHYESGATEFEKDLIRTTVVRAARKMRVRGAGAEPGKAETPPPPKAAQSAVPSPEAIASALYETLARDRRAKVEGDPRKAQKTQLNGEWDLLAVARALMMKLA
ncbi:hypothetical protein [Reyranella sp.]|uniref:hypothetical protein n=1 Tax=Reyranella sp. TaxID=1929291 RepID=UPI003D0B4D36